MSHNITRRNFVKSASLATAGLIMGTGVADAADIMAGNRKKKKTAVPEEKPLEKVRLACIGIGNRGRQIIDEFDNTGLCNIVALCDVDPESQECQITRAKHPDAKLFKDFRRLFDEFGSEFEAVSIAVPDFSHFPIAMLAISQGKHVYVEKPMARTFTECELLMDIARRHPEVVTQVGNQGHSEANYFQFKAWQDAGIIKDVYKIVAHFNDWRRWYPYDQNITKFPDAEPVPEGMDWQTWLTTAKHHEYNSQYHPGNWRGWYDFGMGAIGDWGAHIIDTCHQFLNLGLPYEIDPVKVTGLNDFFFPLETTLRFKFGPRGDMPPVDLYWYDGENNLPPLPEGYNDVAGQAVDVPASGQNSKVNALRPGKIIYSKDLIFKGGSHASTLQIIPKAKADEMAGQLPEVPETPSNHFANFLNACRGLEETRSPFSVFGPMCQTFALGVVAIRCNKKLYFDPVTKTITNDKFANALLTGDLPRKGWEEYYKL